MRKNTESYNTRGNQTRLPAQNRQICFVLLYLSYCAVSLLQGQNPAVRCKATSMLHRAQTSRFYLYTRTILHIDVEDFRRMSGPFTSYRDLCSRLLEALQPRVYGYVRRELLCAVV